MRRDEVASMVKLSAMDEIHGRYRALRWARILDRAEQRYGRARLKGPLSSFILKRALPLFGWYFRPILRAIGSVRRNYGVHRNVGILRQIIQVTIFAETFRVDPDLYYLYRLHRNWARRNDYIYHDEIVALLFRLNPRVGPVDFADLSDKRRFYDRAALAQLPVIPILAEFVNGVASDRISDPSAYERDLFSKVTEGYGGEGATLWRYQGSHVYGNGMEQFSLADLRTHLSQQSISTAILLQPRISNHRDLLPISGNALATVRVVSVRHPSGRSEIAVACYRMGAGRSVVDNFGAGGIASPVDLESGVLGRGVTISGTDSVVCHPDTGAAICGMRLPWWQRVKDLALEAHRLFCTIPVIGWDIAITDEGPIVVEGNGVPGVNVIQMSHQTPLADSVIPDCLGAHLRSLPPNAHL
jgi:Sugar-transfer associated ATP-grasp